MDIQTLFYISGTIFFLLFSIVLLGFAGILYALHVKAIQTIDKFSLLYEELQRERRTPFLRYGSSLFSIFQLGLRLFIRSKRSHFFHK